MHPLRSMSSNRHFDVVIIGCGAVGAAVAREMTLLGQKCLVLEKNAHVLDEASSGNTGHLARNFQYTRERAPLEFEMTRQAATKHNQEWLDCQVNVPRRKCGLLMVARTEHEFQTITDYHAKGLANGEDVTIIDRDQLKRLEPDLEMGDEPLGALYSPEEYVVDPFLLPLSNLYVALHYGCSLETKCTVTKVARDSMTNLWIVEAEKEPCGGSKVFSAKIIVNCGGNYSDEIDTLPTPNDPLRFTIQPGRGEYVVLRRKDSGTAGPRRMVCQVPTQAYAGLYIFPSVYGNFVVGPTNNIQSSKEDRKCHEESIQNLKSHIFTNYPSLRGYEIEKCYAGLRPRCPENKDYQIRFNKEKNWATLGAIRSTGLTASRAIAEYCAKNIFGEDKYKSMSRRQEVTMPKPEVNQSGTIRVGKFVFTPTHTLSRLGLLS